MLSRSGRNGAALASLLDQCAVALFNLVVVIFMARTSSVDAFGLLMLAWTVHGVAIYSFQYTLNSWILARAGGTSNGDAIRGAVAALSTMIASAGGTVALFIYAVVLRLPTLTSVSLGVLLIALIMQSTMRTWQIRLGRPHMALVTSSLSLLVMAMCVLGNSQAGSDTGHFLASVALGQLVVAGPIVFSSRAHGGKLGQLVHEFMKDLPGSLAGLVTVNAIQFGVPVILGSISIAQVGAYRGGQTLVSAPLQLVQGLQPLLLRSQAQHVQRTSNVNGAILRRWNALVSALVLVSIPTVLVIPEGWGEVLLGSTWEHARPVIPVLLIGAAAAQMVFGLETIYRACGWLTRLGAVRLPWCVLALGAVGVGSVFHGAAGAAWAMAASSTALYMALRYDLHRREGLA